MVDSFTDAVKKQLRQRKVKPLAQVTQQSWESDSGSLTSELTLVITALYLLSMFQMLLS